MKYEEKPTRKSFVDLEGKRFVMLTVLGYKGRDDKKQHLWYVQCDCGNDKVIIEAGMRAGATNSCGCLRKNNGGNLPLTQEQAEQLCPKVKFIEYKGMKHPATFKCVDCGKEGYAILANSLRDYKCECQITGAELKRTELFKAKGFTLLKSEGWYCRKHTIRCDYCETESVYQGTLEYIDECKCRLDVKSEEPSAIYCLYNNTDNYIKVGKSITPIRRQGEINSSRESIGLVPMEIYKIIWVVSEKASYYLESLYHNKHKEYRLYLDDWTGSTETFSLGVDSFDKFIEDHDKLISKLKTDEPPKHTLQYNPYYESYEIDGIWYPNKKSITDTLGISSVYINNYLGGRQTMHEILNPPQICYNGICDTTLSGLCRKLKISAHAINKRTNRGASLEDAISDVLSSPPPERVRMVMVDGVKMKLKDLWKMFGIDSTKSANNVFRMLNKDVYATLRKYGISTDKKIELLRLLD